MILEWGTPERWCRPSTFWVMMALMRPCATSLARARWPALGSALSMVSSVAKLAPPRLAPHFVRGHEVIEVDRLVAGPDAARRAEVRNSRLRRDSRAGEGDDALGRTDQFPQQLDVVHKPSCRAITAPAWPDCEPHSRRMPCPRFSPPRYRR